MRERALVAPLVALASTLVVEISHLTTQVVRHPQNLNQKEGKSLYKAKIMKMKKKKRLLNCS
jgi:hypothetical protein